MPEDIDILLRHLIGGDPAAAEHIRDRATGTDVPALLVAAAVITAHPEDLHARAAGFAVSTRDRQLVAVATAHLGGDTQLLDVLVREHLSDFPDNILAAWIAAEHVRTGQSTSPHPGSCYA
jgi:hypothetical protein